MTSGHEQHQGMHPRATIRLALLQQWDPIGVADIPEAQDEYDAYVDEIHQLLLNGKTERELFDYLWSLETQHMGLSGDRATTEKFARWLAEFSQQMEGGR
jgi:hypothetical protein